MRLASCDSTRLATQRSMQHLLHQPARRSQGPATASHAAATASPAHATCRSGAIRCRASSSSSSSSPAPGGRDGGGRPGDDTSAFLQSIQQQFDARAPTYDTDNSYHPPLAAALLDLLQLQPGPTRVLDLAAGTGLVGLAAAAAVGQQGSVVMVDVSAGMLAQAKAKHAATAIGAAPPSGAAAPPPPAIPPAAVATTPPGIAAVHFMQGDIEDLPSCLPRGWLGSFDAITCSAAIPFLRHPPAALAAWRAWLKQPGGRLAFNAFVPPALEDFGTFRQLLAEAGVAEVPEPCEVLGSVEAVTSALKAAGYTQVQVKPETKERWMKAASIEAFAASTWVTAVQRNPFFTGPVQQQLAAITAANTPQAPPAGSVTVSGGGGGGGAQQGPAAVLDPGVAPKLAALRQAFIETVVQDIRTNGRCRDEPAAAGGTASLSVLNRYTVLHLLAQV